MIQASVIHSRILSRLDAEGSDRYTFDQDTKYAINSAMEILITMFNQAFAENKLTPESLRELNIVGVWQANSFSRIAFSEAEVGHGLWSIIAVYPECETYKKVALAKAGTDDKPSSFRKDVTFVKSIKSAKRFTQEEWNENIDNAFMPGNDILKGELKEYSYLDFANYTSTSYVGGADKVEITIRPDVPNKLVAIAYLKYPNQVSAPTDTIEFPKSITELITDIALSVIAEKQGDGTNLYAVSERSINLLVSLIK
jgi:hypothetical protein